MRLLVLLTHERSVLLRLGLREQMLLLVAHGRKVRVRHGLARRQSLLVVIFEQLVEKVDRLVRDVPLVLGRDEARPRLAREAPEDVVKLGREVNLVFLCVRAGESLSVS